MKELEDIEKQIENIKRQLQTIGVMRPGSLTKQYKEPKEKKGAYYQVSYTLDMKSHTDYVRKDFVENVRQQIDDYKKFRDLTKKWILLSIKYSKLQIAQAAKKK
jgi:hypothetical protein